MNNKGIMLIEMLVVIVVLGIVAAISIPSVQGVYANVQKDTVLNQARDIESAARFYCRLNNYTSCTEGMIIGDEELSTWLDSTLDGYEYSVTMGEGINDFYVHLLKGNDYSFPYNEDGEKIALGQVPSQTTKDLVNISQDGIFEGYQSFESGETYLGGDYVIYNGALYQAHWYTTSVPSTDTSWQEITDEYRDLNTYQAGDSVIHNGSTYVANWYTQGVEPGTSSAWEKQIEAWFSYNTYYQGDQVYHHGNLYEANYWTQGNEPGTTGHWTNLSTDIWNANEIYNLGDEVSYDGIIYRAKWWTQGQRPDQNSNTWDVWEIIG